eukprot:3305586-Amphidinium_carterae.1
MAWNISGISALQRIFTDYSSGFLSDAAQNEIQATGAGKDGAPRRNHLNIVNMYAQIMQDSNVTLKLERVKGIM